MIGMTRNYREINGEISIKEKYYISDLKLSGAEFAEVVRKHWGVENNLHAPLDIVFKEDSNKMLKKNGAKNLRIIKRIVFLY